MIFKNTRLRLIVLSVIALLLLGFLGFDLYNIRAKNDTTSKLLTLADQEAEEKILVQSIRLIQNNAREDIEAFEGIVLSDDGVVRMIESVERAGQSLGLETEIISVEKTGEETLDNPQKIRLVIESNGLWAATFSYLRAIESLPHRVMIEKVDFSKGKDVWHSRIALSLYLFK